MKVLLATEGSKYGDAAIEMCGRMFQGPEKIELRVISAIEPAIPAIDPLALSSDYIDSIERAGREQANEVIAKAESNICSRFPALASSLTTTVVMGNPSQAVVEEAESWGADLIITGSHGHGFWKRALLGSVSDAIVHHAPCSVMVVRNNTDKDK